MEREFWIIIVIVVTMMAILIALVYGCLNDILNLIVDNKMLKKYKTSLSNILKTYYNSKDYEQCIFELEILYKNVVEANEFLKRRYVNIYSIIEMYITDIDAEKVELSIDDKDDYKKEIINLLCMYKDRNPLGQLKGEATIAFKECIECYEKGEIEKARTIISEIAFDMNNLRNIIYEKDKSRKKQDKLTYLGIFLSIFFGTISIIQFFIG